MQFLQKIKCFWTRKINQKAQLWYTKSRKQNNQQNKNFPTDRLTFYYKNYIKNIKDLILEVCAEITYFGRLGSCRDYKTSC